MSKAAGAGDHRVREEVEEQRQEEGRIAPLVAAKARAGSPGERRGGDQNDRAGAQIAEPASTPPRWTTVQARKAIRRRLRRALLRGDRLCALADRAVGLQAEEDRAVGEKELRVARPPSSA